jgi:hypothetical protein
VAGRKAATSGPAGLRRVVDTVYGLLQRRRRRHELATRRRRADFRRTTEVDPLSQWMGDSWAVRLTPKDFTPVCTTELGYMEISPN